jgi:hypothetical protein
MSTLILMKKMQERQRSNHRQINEKKKRKKEKEKWISDGKLLVMQKP